MDYQKIYQDFIQDRREKEAELIASGEYVERHHIVPKSMGGSDAKSNMIALRASDHYFAHLVLAKIHGYVMWCALHLLSQVHSTAKKRGVYGKKWIYEKIKIEMSSAFSGEGNPFYGKNHSEETKEKIRQISLSMSEETKQKMSDAAIGKHISLETRKKLSAAFSGEGNPFYGKNHSEETKRKISIKNVGYKPTEETLKKLSVASSGENNPMYGKKHSEETKRKISNKRKGSITSEETKKKISIAFSGEGNPFYGKKHSPETIKRIIEGNKGDKHPSAKKVRCIETGRIFGAASMAAEWLNMASGSVGIIKVCKGKAKTAGGYRWEYV